MCDYCSCRSMPVIEDLGADHEALLDLADDVERSIARHDESAARRQFARLVEGLRLHTAVEEASVFAALVAARELVDDVDALTGDHNKVWTDVENLDLLEGDAWGAAVARVLADLRGHITQEEYDLFPATLVAIGPQEWDAVELAAAGVRGHGS